MRARFVLLFLSAFLFPFNYSSAQSTLPSGWSDGDVGSVAVAGSATYANGVFTVQGAGQYVWNTADGMNFAYQSLSGDGTIVARIVSLHGGSTSSSAGVMIRETLDAGSAHVDSVYEQGAVYAVYRTSAGGNTSADSTGNASLPYWVKVVRSSNSFSSYSSCFSSYSSSDGVSWVQMGTTHTISMAQNVYVGLAVSGDNWTTSNPPLATATFDNVSITSPAAPAAPVITSLSPASGSVATSVTVAGANFGSTQGTSTLTFNGTPASPSSWSATSILASVPSGATTGNIVVTETSWSRCRAWPATARTSQSCQLPASPACPQIPVP